MNYVVGDATKPILEGNKIIAHICNDCGKWGKGFVLSISKRWKEPENLYKWWYNTAGFGLGEVQLVQVENDIFIANMIAQRGIYPVLGIPPIRYEYVKQCLEKVNRTAINMKASLHMPMIGSGLAGGDWKIIEKIILETVTVKTLVYRLK